MSIIAALHGEPSKGMIFFALLHHFANNKIEGENTIFLHLCTMGLLLMSYCTGGLARPRRNGL